MGLTPSRVPFQPQFSTFVCTLKDDLVFASYYDCIQCFVPVESKGSTELFRLIVLSDTFELCVQGDGYSYSSSGTIFRRKRSDKELILVPSWFKVVTNRNTITGADAALEYVSVLAPHVGTDVGRVIASYIDFSFNIRRISDKGYYLCCPQSKTPFPYQFSGLELDCELVPAEGAQTKTTPLEVRECERVQIRPRPFQVFYGTDDKEDDDGECLSMAFMGSRGKLKRPTLVLEKSEETLLPRSQ
jgi:hypothetical protein